METETQCESKLEKDRKRRSEKLANETPEATSHKMQGGKLDLGVADLSGLFAKGQAYVMLSRFRSLDGLKIENINPQQLTGKKPCNTDALEEMERMRKLPAAF